jgi:glucoamylase
MMTANIIANIIGRRKLSFGLALVFFSTLVTLPSQVWATDLNSWISTESVAAQSLMLQNISRPGTGLGSVVAAPAQGANPDYYYHWVRDSGLTMQAVVGIYDRATGTTKAQYFQILSNFVDFSTYIQQSSNLSGNPWDTGIGEPKFNVDGSDYSLDWGRPQSDGPAIRASAMIHFANLLLDQGQIAYVQQKLYSPSLPATTLIKADLEYISHHWQDPSFDLWEEVEGTHFYTRMVQRRALVEGAEFATEMGDSNAAAFYSAQAQQILGQLADHWSAQENYLVETINQTGGHNNKISDIDSAAVLGALHGTISLHNQASYTSDDSLYGVTDDRVLLTSLRLKQVFQSLYTINQTGGPNVGPGIGRYPEDTYNGTDTASQGNPWFLTTLAFAESYYKAATAYETSGSIPVTRGFVSWFTDIAGSSSSITLNVGETIHSSDFRFSGILSTIRLGGDRFLARCQLHADPSGALSEEFNRNNGFMQGAANLTWSYASFLTAIWARGN